MTEFSLKKYPNNGILVSSAFPINWMGKGSIAKRNGISNVEVWFGQKMKTLFESICSSHSIFGNIKEQYNVSFDQYLVI